MLIMSSANILLAVGLGGLLLCAAYILRRNNRHTAYIGRFISAGRLLGFLMLAGAVGELFLRFLPNRFYAFDPRYSTIADIWFQLDKTSLAHLQNYLKTEAQTFETISMGLLGLPACSILAFIGAVLLFYPRPRPVYATSVPPAEDGANLADPATRPKQRTSTHSELYLAISSVRTALMGVGIFSAICNVLMLTGALFMLQVYDRVLPSRSVATLLALSLLVFGLFSLYALFDMIRRRILLRIGASLDEAISVRIYDLIIRRRLTSADHDDGLQPLRDTESIRSFLSGQGPVAFYDLPWIPVYIGIIYLMHPALGFAALAGAIVLFSLALMTEALTRQPMADAANFSMQRNSLALAGQRNAEVLTAMGMTGRMGAKWRTANQNFMSTNRRASDVAIDLGSSSRALRLMLQSAVLGIGAYFVIQGQASAGIIIAASVLVARALAPVDLAISNWKGFVAARQSWRRLGSSLNECPAQTDPMQLPPPQTRLTVENVSAAPPNQQKLTIQSISFELQSGHGLGIVGPSGSGKTTLARLLVGVWQPARGRIQLDGAALSQWAPDALGRHIGYVPQEVELFAGTVAENIARFEPHADPKTITSAAKAAAVHDMIVGLPDGYETEIGEQGRALSAGQRQRIALARALYRDPFLVVLDEANSHLDAEGQAALTKAVLGVRERGGVVVMVAHRHAALAGVDLILTMSKGKAVAFGKKAEVLEKLLRPKANEQSQLNLIAGTGTSST
jgi:ATP-binding cassette, subfamily C, type I secretion system permease/ATPase